MILPVPSPQTQGGLTRIPLSDAGGITQFGLSLQSLIPGAAAAKRPWHSAVDERALTEDPVPGTRRHSGAVHDPDHELVAHKDGTARRYLQEA